MNKPELYQNKYRVASARLPGYDYGQNGAYFITICVAGRQPHFGVVEVLDNDGATAQVRATPLGERVLQGWHAIPAFAPFVTLDAFVLMPDHVHGLLLFDKPEPAGSSVPGKAAFAPQRDNLAAIVRGFKAGVSSFARSHAMAFNWQSRFYDRVVRSDEELSRIRAYILANPDRWAVEQHGEEWIFR